MPVLRYCIKVHCMTILLHSNVYEYIFEKFYTHGLKSLSKVPTVYIHIYQNLYMFRLLTLYTGDRLLTYPRNFIFVLMEKKKQILC